ncbi:hypothetical protein IPZ68_38280 [Streptomyces arenae]|nr:hypothetical protein [Streptomyces arenae]
MKSLNVKRAFVAASMVAGVLAVPVATAAPASAASHACTDFVKWGGYKVGPKVKAACKGAAKGAGTPASWINVAACKAIMATLGVRESVANDACRSAAGM